MTLIPHEDVRAAPLVAASLYEEQIRAEDVAYAARRLVLSFDYRAQNREKAMDDERVMSVLSAAALLAGLGDTARVQNSGGVKLTVLYAKQKDPEAFTKHYFETHMPMVDNVPGVIRSEVATVLSAPPGQPAPAYYRITEMYWESAEAMKKSMATPEWKAVVDDVPNFADPGTLSAFSSVIGS